MFLISQRNAVLLLMLTVAFAGALVHAASDLVPVTDDSIGASNVTPTVPPANADPLQKKAEAALVAAELDIEEIRSLGVSTEQTQDLFVEAKRAVEGDDLELLLAKAKYLNSTSRPEDYADALALFEKVRIARETNSPIGTDYALALEKAAEIGALKQEAFTLQNDLQRLNMEIDALNASYPGEDLSLVFATRDKAFESFRNDRFGESRQWMQQSYAAAEQVRLNYSALRAELASVQHSLEAFVKQNFFLAIAVAAALVLLAWLALSFARASHLQQRIADLKLERGIMEKLLRANQENYFGGRKISKHSFESKRRRFDDRVIEIRSELPVLEAELAKLRKNPVLRALSGN